MTASPATAMSETFRRLVESIDGEISTNRAQMDILLRERDRLSAARNALVPPAAQSAKQRPVKPRPPERATVPDIIRRVIREHPHQPFDVTVRMASDARKVKEGSAAASNIASQIQRMIEAREVHKSPDGTLSLPASAD